MADYLGSPMATPPPAMASAVVDCLRAVLSRPTDCVADPFTGEGSVNQNGLTAEDVSSDRQGSRVDPYGQRQPEPRRLIINTATGKIEKEIRIPTTVKGTHGQFRHIRMTRAGTILVPHMSEGKVVEYDLDGKEVWSVKARSAWSAIRLNSGNTLIAGDASKYVREVNPKGETVWELTQADVPDIKLFNTQTANRLANGNTVICNWCAGNNRTQEWAGTVQVFEVTPAKKVVWALSSWKDPDLGPSASIQLLDEPGSQEDQER